MDRDLARIQEDLTTLRAAAGIDPTWTRRDVQTHIWLAAAGLAAALWAVVPHRWPQVLGLAAFAIPVAIWLGQVRPRPDRKNADEQEVREALRVLWFALPLAAFGVWSRVVGLDPIATAGVIWFMLGLVLFSSAVGERRMRPLLGWAIASMAGGLALPLAVAWSIAVLGLAIAIGAAISGASIAVTLRRAHA
jgi:hypothetical protein